MDILKKLAGWYKVRSIKNKIVTKMEQLNQTEDAPEGDDAARAYPVKEIVPGANDAQVREYLAQHPRSFSGIGPGWQPYLYELIDELIDNGLRPEDQVWAKEKYGTFRAGVITSQAGLQQTFDKIVAAYTSKIDTICQFCNGKGTHQQFNNWEYNLCLQHYLAFKYKTPYDAEIDYYLELGSNEAEEAQAAYRHLSAGAYHVLEELLFKEQATVLYQLLKERWPGEQERIYEIVHRYFYETGVPVVSLGDRLYTGRLQFVAADGDREVVERTQDDHYNSREMQEGIIDALFKAAGS